MKVNGIKLNIPINFTIEQDDWEGAPDPICMTLVDDESWHKVAKCLEDDYEYIYVGENGTEDEILDDFWADYEKYVLHLCKVFYYEDMTNKEYNTYKSLDEDKQEEYLEIVYNRIKSEQNG